MKKRYYFHIHFAGIDAFISGVTLVSHDEKEADKEALDYAKSKVSVDLVCEDEDEGIDVKPQEFNEVIYENGATAIFDQRIQKWVEVS